MKKTIVLLQIIFTGMLSFGQSKDLPKDETGKIVFTEVVQVDGADAKTLYSRAKLFAADVYRSAQDVTQLDDPATNTIVLKPIIKNNVKSLMVSGPWGHTRYQLNIACKDGRYKYTATSFIHEHPNGAGSGGDLEQEKAKGFTDKTWKQIQQQAIDAMNLIIPELKKHMSSNNSLNSDKW